DTPQAVADIQTRFGRERAAAAVEDFFGAVARGAVALGFGGIVVAGGETSGAVVSALGIDSLVIGREIDPGVPAMVATTGGGRDLHVVLKSGNFGGPDFFATAVAALGGADA